MIVYGWSRVTAAMRSSSSATSRPRPRSRSVSSGIASPVSPDGSMTMIVSSAGRSPRTCRIFATWVASSQTIATDSELPATHWHSSGEFVG